jgi:hypothetical protein
MRYLRKGSAKAFGEDLHLRTVECSHRSKRNWAALESICQKAMHGGRARLDLSEFEVLWAYPPGQIKAVVAELKRYEHQSGCFGTSSGLMNMADGLFPPPTVWRIPSELKFAVLEEEIEVAHFLDVRAFERDLGQGHSIQMFPSDACPIRVRVGDNVYPLSLHFAYDVLYGFETIDSCVEGLIEFAILIDKTHTQLTTINDVETAKPDLLHVDSIEGAVSLLKSRGSAPNTLVSMPPSMLEYLGNKKTIQSNTPTPSINDGLPAYAILEWEDFKHLMDSYIKTQHPLK